MTRQSLDDAKGAGTGSIPTRRPTTAAALAACLAVSTWLGGVVDSARGQSVGDLFEKAAKDFVRQQIDPGKSSGQRSFSPMSEAEPFTVRTADGWDLVAHRFKSNSASGSARPPVILCHGLSYNAVFWDLDASCSFARYLAERGLDVWVVSLRGCGLSRKWVMKVDAAPSVLLGDALRRMTKGKLAPTGFASLDPKYSRWNLDDHVSQDVPAFVSLVRRHTRAPEVVWVGHSMGGIVALCHLARFQNPGIGQLVTIGSQVTMPEGQVMVQFLKEMLGTRQSELAGQLTPEDLINKTQTSVHNLFFNVNNVRENVYIALGTWAKDQPSIELLQQYMVLGTKGELYNAPKTMSYAQAMGNVKVPILITCGAADRLAPPKVQQELYNRVGSTDKTLVIFGRRNGQSVDPGHNDTLVGHQSRSEVFPVIESWINARAGTNPPTTPTTAAGTSTTPIPPPGAGPGVGVKPAPGVRPAPPPIGNSAGMVKPPSPFGLPSGLPIPLPRPATRPSPPKPVGQPK